MFLRFLAGRFQNVCNDFLQNLAALGFLDLGKRNQRVVSVFLRLLFRKRNAVVLDHKRANPRDILLRQVAFKDQIVQHAGRLVAQRHQQRQRDIALLDVVGDVLSYNFV